MRWRLERLLGAVREAKLPPSAILLVQTLETELTSSQLTSALLPGKQQWAYLLQRTLIQATYAAQRPNHGVIPPGAKAILFIDEAEALACLLLAWLHNNLEQWWCRSLQHHWGLSQFKLVTVLSTHARCLPGVITLLTRWQVAFNLIASLTDDEALAIVQTVIETFELSTVQPFFSQLPASMPSFTRLQTLLPPPWQQWLPAMNGLSKPQAALLGVALTIQQRPMLLHSPAVLTAWQAWWEEKTAVSPLPTPPPTQPTVGLGQHLSDEKTAVPPNTLSPVTDRLERGLSAYDATSSATPSQRLPDGRTAVSQKVPSPTIERGLSAYDADTSSQRLPDEKTAVSPPTPPTAQTHLAHPDSPTNPAAWAVSPTVPQTAVAAENSGGKTAVFPPNQPPAATATPEQNNQPVSLAETAIHSRLGGVFYLINVLLALDIPAGLAGEQGQVSPWVALEGVARLLLAAAVDGDICYAKDGLWELLAGLNGRSATKSVATLPLGHDFTPSPPTQPLTAWPPPAPLPPLAADNPLLAAIAPSFLNWLQFVTPFVLGQLQQTVPDLLIPSITSLLAIPARIYATHTHLDVILPLEAIALPVRLAGLDFDPGWLPRWGRVVLFHYE